MMFRRVGTAVLIGSLAVCASAQPAFAQLKATVYTTGLTLPLDIVQDPLHTNVQFVVQQGGRIRVVQDRVVQAQDFLNMTGLIGFGGERGLLGLAFAPDYATSRRFYIYFTDANGDLVISRFLRSTTDSLRADTTTRLDFQWAPNQRVIPHPTFANHNGGHLAFGPDGYLYAGTGDGGSGDDPPNNAQNPLSLLGKMLRLDINGAHQDTVGYDIPPSNPFVGRQDVRPEIWAVGVRNPWRFSFDPISAGGTNALVIADVGQGRYEEIDYEPANTGGRNYGWRNREGMHDEVTSLPPAYLPLTEPIFEYDHTVGQSITGGFVFRGSNLPSRFRGRYFFADYVAGRVWSIGLTIGQGGNATAGALEEHTGELGGSTQIGNISSFGLGPSGELFIVGYSKGNILRIESSVASNPQMTIETPVNGIVVQPFAVSGWAIDLGAPSGNGVDTVHIWAIPQNGPAIFLGASAGLSRPDVAATFGDQFGSSGFGVVASHLPGGPCQIIAYAHSTVTGQFSLSQVRAVMVASPILHFDPLPPGPFSQPFQLTGWAINTGATSSNGIDFVHVWALPEQGTPFFLGMSGGQPRPDIALQYGDQFANSGFVTTVHDLPFGVTTIVAYGHDELTDQFSVWDITQVLNPPQAEMQLEIESPANSSQAPGIVTLTGWSIDPASFSGPGTDVLHVWAFDENNVAQFLGWTLCTIDRPDIASQYGQRFLKSGWTLTATDLHPGRWTLAVYAHSSVTHTFRTARTVVINITQFQAGMRLVVEQPSAGQVVAGSGVIRGWTLDLGAAPGTTGVSTVHIWNVPTNGANATFLGTATMGIDRPDIAANFGSQFQPSGFEWSFNLPPGTYNIVVYAFRVRTQEFAATAVVTITVQEPPPTNETISTSDPSLISSSP